MSEVQLQELGYRLTGLEITLDESKVTALNWGITVININSEQLWYLRHSLFSRGYLSNYLSLQVLLHEVAHLKQYLKYGKRSEVIFNRWYLSNKRRAEKIADRYALMYYKRFVKVF